MPLDVISCSTVHGYLSSAPLNLAETKITQKNIAWTQRSTKIIRVIEASKLLKRASNTRGRTKSIQKDKWNPKQRVRTQPVGARAHS